MGLKRMLMALALLSSASALASEGELGAAVKNNEVEHAKSLILAGADVNRVLRDGTTHLQWAIYNDNVSMAESLLLAGADVDRANREGMTPLALGAMGGNPEIVRLLLDAGADTARTLPNGETPLMMAARTGDSETLRLLLEQGAGIDAREDLRGTTALMWAAANGNAPAVELLLAHGADSSLRSAPREPGRGPYLAPTARERIREFYFGEGLRGSSVNIEVDGREVELTREELLERIPDTLVEDFERERRRREQGNGKSDDAGEKQWGGLTALHFAAREGDMASVKALIEAGADINQVSEFGWTPLLTATQNRYYRIGQYLLEQGADPNIANAGGWNPLYIATDNRNIEGGDYPTRLPDMDHLAYIKLLLAAGANPNLRMKSSTETRTIFTHQWLREDGATPFLRAAQSSDLELMRLLLDHGADPTINTRDGVTPLMVAAGIGWVEGVTYEWSEDANQETIRWLLELGQDPNARDREDGRTALMGAAHKGRNYAVEMLVEAGADLAARDIGSRDSFHKLAGVTWQAIDYAEGLVRVGVQSALSHPETAALIRRLMRERGLEVPPEGRTLDSICVVDLCK